MIMDESQCTSKSVAQPQGNSVTESKNTLDADEEGFVNDGGTPSQCTKDKGRKTTSEAWNYFTREEVNGVTRAVCKHCGVSLVTGGNSGTSHLLKHAKKVCSGRHLNLARGQTTLRVKKECDGSSSLEFSGKSKLKEFDQEFFDGNEVDMQLARVRRCLDNLVVEYQRKSDLAKNMNDVGVGQSRKRPAPSSIDGVQDEFAQSKRTKVRKVNRCELDFYLEEEPLSDDEDLDVLYWWKVNTKYPTLQKIAKDILAIPVSSVASESAFSTGGRVISPHRSRLHSQTVEALMCLQNWMMEDMKGSSEDAHACSTVIDDSDVDVEQQIDVIQLDLDEIEED